MNICVIGCGIVGTFIAWLLKSSGFKVRTFSLRRKYPKIGLIQSLMQKYDEDILLAKSTRELYAKVIKEFNLENCIKIVKSYTVLLKDHEYKIVNLIEKWRGVGADVYRLDNYQDIDFKVYDNEVVYVCNNDIIVRIDKIVYSLWRDIDVKLCEAKIKIEDLNNVKVITRNESITDFDYVIVTCGAWTRRLLFDNNIKIPLIPYKCQAGIFLISSNSMNYILYDYVNRIYVRPCGYLSKLKIGNMRFAVCGNGNTPPQEPTNKAKVESWFKHDILPRLSRRYRYAKYIIGSAGYCDTSPDSRPIVAFLGKVIVISGFDGYGAEIGPGLADEVIKYLTTGKISNILKTYLVDRFGSRSDVGLDKLPEVEAHEL